ncbi:PREDICTED: putative BTB/POZ domain-containing protein At2g40440 [Brassica oleracea var. oleracea]|uniref:putative BTB/POZ domain-containing protein At2g40440 n=1 Tax=Brassica oleracea var. oleracea TaxID=109376 RepID=UPI0006A6B9F9|nr:PREDICTED: putative BTB/POZ domain-containing protein At2g40440 [Brassica oleracea var. oleracea]
MLTRSNKDIFVRGFAKALEEKWQVDVQLKGRDSDEGVSIFAHKLVLASRSEVLKKILELDEFKAPSQRETVTFSELKHEELEALVKFIYSDGSKLSAKAKEHVRSLYVTADKYEIPHLRDLCRNELVKSLNLSNALEVLELSLIPLDNALHDAAFSYIIKNLKTIVNSLEFKLFANRNTDLTVEIIRAFMARRNIYY